MKACIITIGDELLIGDTVDTNATWMAHEMDNLGIETHKIITVRDLKEDIQFAVMESEKWAEITLITGGLGPTHDDVTKKALCEHFGDELVYSELVYSDVVSLVRSFGKEMNEMNKTQAMVPSSAEIIRNYRGTAPGFIFRNKGKMVVSMPGVPHEMKNMMRSIVLKQIPEIKKKKVIHRHIRTFGIAESDLAEKIGEVTGQLNPALSMAFLPSPGHVNIRITVRDGNDSDILQIVNETEKRILELAGEFVYGFGDDRMEFVTGKLLTGWGKTIATAESCSGGRLASKITEVPGSSNYYLGSVIVYSNEIKERILGIDRDLIAGKGAVSEEVVKAMAMEVKKLFRTDYGLSTSGIAGPDGGSDEKPVGTIWLALASPEGVKTRKINLGFNRKINIELTADYALDMMRRELLKIA